MDTEEELAPREPLESQGWKKCFAACEPRLSEAVDLYESLGFEVRLEPLAEAPQASCGGGEECRICFQEDIDSYRVIFTRRGGAKSSDESPG